MGKIIAFIGYAAWFHKRAGEISSFAFFAARRAITKLNKMRIVEIIHFWLVSEMWDENEKLRQATSTSTVYEIINSNYCYYFHCCNFEIGPAVSSTFHFTRNAAANCQAENVQIDKINGVAEYVFNECACDFPRRQVFFAFFFSFFCLFVLMFLVLTLFGFFFLQSLLLSNIGVTVR